ncbi:MAG: DUF1648 domain-containing protein [Terracidiphilus sp.]
MRKALEIVSLFALAALLAVTVSAFYGPARLPDRIPTHFNAAGRANAWGSPYMLLVIPLIAATVYVLMTLVSRYPTAFNYPVRVTPQNQQRLEDLALGMTVWLKTEVVSFLAWMQWNVIRLAHHPGPGLSPYLMPLLLVAVFATILFHLSFMLRAGRRLSQR